MRNILFVFFILVLSINVGCKSNKDCPPVNVSKSKPSQAERKIARKQAKAQEKFDKAMLKKKKGHYEFQDKETRKRMKKNYKKAEKKHRRY